jgi:hypothetical protein
MRKFPIFIVSIGLVVACSGDDQKGSEDSNIRDPIVAALAAVLATNNEETGFSSSEAMCVASGFVDSLGIDFFLDNEISPEDIDSNDPFEGIDLNQEQATAMADMLFSGECFDIVDVFAREIFADEPGVLDGDQIRCFVSELLDSPGFREAFVASMTGDNSEDPFESIEDIFSIFLECDISFEDLAELGQLVG